MRKLEGHSEAVLALAVGRDCLVSGSYDTTLRFWDLATLRCTRQVRGAADSNVCCYVDTMMWF